MVQRIGMTGKSDVLFNEQRESERDFDHALKSACRVCGDVGPVEFAGDGALDEFRTIAVFLGRCDGRAATLGPCQA